jgi:hypothetical protein
MKVPILPRGPACCERPQCVALPKQSIGRARHRFAAGEYFLITNAVLPMYLQGTVCIRDPFIMQEQQHLCFTAFANSFHH